ncbi:probable inactive receptor kinase At2g26730 [Rhodamnia argentea]|uniref:Probable inactive receptor kinase At2g26730 n=1 Tax=Rhodamnia argentea TaxID=178133 RepID=A0A8B8QVG2_9MYRT|nr:probable inactive receptor kinase At2g26730 [Rhodamnia argentea]
MLNSPETHLHLLMFSIMRSSMSLGKFFLTSLILLLNHRITASSALPLGYDGDEREALYVLRAAFNNSLLNSNWRGIHCYMDDPPRWYGIQCNNGRVTVIALEGMGLKGVVNSDALIHFSELSILSFKNNALLGNIMNFSGNQKLAQIDLSGNKFHGPISESLLSLALLASLKLQNNNLSGKIPEFNQPTLIYFNVSNNNLGGQIPLTQVVQSFSLDSFSGNLGLCGSPTHNSCNNSSVHDSVSDGPSSSNPSGTADNDTKKSKQSSISGYAFLFLLFAVVALLAVILLLILYNKKAKELKNIVTQQNRRAVEAEDKKEDKSEAVESGTVVERGEDRGKLIFLENGGGFELSDLLKASAEGLGKGIFGNTYKAILDNGKALVVKRMRDLKPMTSEEFTRQLQLLANQKHPNLIPPLAYFFSKQEKLLIYRYAEKGNLFNRIHGGRGSKERVPFRWNSRLSAARGVARALQHLHANSRTNNIIPHGNLKSTNVLLNQNNIILVSDYGLSSLIALPIAAQSMVCFKSPEYQTTRRIYPNTDVWSYGCMLIELLSGRVCANAAPPGVKGVDLCSWVHRAVREEWTAEIFDSEISVQRSAAHGMLQLLQIAIRCCDKSPDKRPEMAEIAQEIEKMKAAVDSEDEEDVSVERSLTDESFATTSSIAAADDR